MFDYLVGCCIKLLAVLFKDYVLFLSYARLLSSDFKQHDSLVDFCFNKLLIGFELIDLDKIILSCPPAVVSPPF